jgi:hypothetical protein
VITIIGGVAAIVTNVWKVSKDLHDLINGIKNAPRHIQTISDDLRGLYVALGALQGLLPKLDTNRESTDLVPMFEPIFESLQLNLENCFHVLVETSTKLGRYTKPSGGMGQNKWTAFRWQFKEKDIAELRGQLAAYKMTVNLALATANL